MLYTGLMLEALLPIFALSILIVLFRRKRHAYFAGMGVGLLSYLIIGFLLGALLQNLILAPITSPWAYVFCLAGMTALLDFAARYASTLVFKSRDPVRTGLSVGLGQAAGRAFTLDVLKAISFLAIISVYTSEAFDPAMVDGEFMENAQSLMDTPWYFFLADGLEAVCAFITQVALSLYAVKAIMEGNPRGMVTTILIQFALEVVPALLMTGIVSTKYLEYFVYLEAGILSSYLLYKAIKAHPGEGGVDVIRLSRNYKVK